MRVGRKSPQQTLEPGSVIALDNHARVEGRVQGCTR